MINFSAGAIDSNLLDQENLFESGQVPQYLKNVTLETSESQYSTGFIRVFAIFWSFLDSICYQNTKFPFSMGS